MPPSPTDPSEPQRPQQGQRRAYQPPPGAAKPQSPPPSAASRSGPPPMAGGPASRAPMAGGGVPTGRAPMSGGSPTGAGVARPQIGLRGGAFEFTFEQDALLKDLAKNIRTVSWVLLVLGALLLFRHLMPFVNALRAASWSATLDPLLGLLGGAVLLYSFFALRRSAGAFSDIVESESQDLPLLLKALRSLNGMFGVLSLAVIVIGALILLSIVSATLVSGGPPPPGQPKAAPAASPAKSAPSAVSS